MKMELVKKNKKRSREPAHILGCFNIVNNLLPERFTVDVEDEQNVEKADNVKDRNMNEKKAGIISSIVMGLIILLVCIPPWFSPYCRSVGMAEAISWVMGAVMLLAIVGGVAEHYKNKDKARTKYRRVS